MKKQLNSNIKAHLIRGAFYLLLLLAVCAIPFKLAQSRPPAAKRSVNNPAADSMLKHVQSQPAKQARSRFVMPRVPGGISCDNAPGIVIHDDNTIENGYSGNPAVVTEVRFADKFTPSSYPNSYTSVCLDLLTLAGGPAMYNVDIVVYDDDGAGGSPGTLLGALNGQTAMTHTTIPTPVWNSYDISSLGINITSGSVYIGVRFMPPSSGPNVFIASDESTGHPIGFAGGFWWNNNDNAWATIQSAFPNYRSCMIRAVEGAAGPTPTASPTATCPTNYTTQIGSGTLTPGGDDINNHCDDCNTQINLPFPVTVYGTPVTVATVGSNGDLQLTAAPSDKLLYSLGECVPVNPDPTAHGPFLNTLFPNYADLITDANAAQPCTDCGVFTQTLGSAPNRQFVIRWKTTYFGDPPIPGTAEFEVLLTEGSGTLSVIYGQTLDNGLTSTLSGIQQDLNVFTSFSCNQATLTPGLRVDYIPPGCASPTPTATATATATPTATAAPRSTPSPRPRPTPAPRG